MTEYVLFALHCIFLVSIGYQLRKFLGGGESMTYTPTGETWTCPECGHKMVEVQYEAMTAVPVEFSAVACRCQKGILYPPRHQTPFSWDDDEPQLSYAWFDEEWQR